MDSFFVVHHKPVVLVVDDTPENLALMSNLLKDEFQVKVANSGERALRLAQGDHPPELILLDIMMPVMDGYEVCRRLKADPLTEHIPVIFLTAKTETQDETLGLQVGAVDYITKPINPAIVQARIKTHLMLKAASDFQRGKSDILETEVARRTAEIQDLQDAMVLAMASLAETRDNETGNHLRRTQHFVKCLAERLRTHPRFASVLTDTHIRLLFKSAPLHDIGKVGIPDGILLKPGRLSESEFEVMKTHTMLGRDAITHAEQSLGHEVPFLRFAKEIAMSHQEKWDGSGYPEGLRGEQIPLSARLMAMADVYDALISRRVYKPAMSHQEALEILTRGRGTHFDPDVFDAFLTVQDEFQVIAARYIDSDEDLEGVLATARAHPAPQPAAVAPPA
jgi:putative two-component system response regulator